VYKLGNHIFYQGVEGGQFSGSSVALVENEGVGGLSDSKDNLCGGAVVDSTLAMVTCIGKESRGSEIFFDK
jgi:hypothetical protein